MAKGTGKFFGSLASTYFNNGMKSLIEMVAKMDPETTSEAQIDALLKEFDAKSLEVAQAQRDYEKEQKEADVIDALFKQRMKAAENIQTKFNAADEAGKPAFQKSLLSLLGQIEEMKPDVDREKAEAEDAKQLYESMKDVLESFAKQLKTVRSQIEAAKRSMKSSEMKKNRAEMLEANAQTVAGLRQTNDQFNVAMSAMNRVAEKNIDEARAAEERARLLAPTNIEKDDDIIASAMAEASGEKATSAMTIEERLAALKK